MRGERIKDLMNYEKPREKLLFSNPSNLTDVELLALILRTGEKGKSALTLSREILKKYNGLATLAENSSLQELQKTKGVGIAKASEIIAVLEIAKRLGNSQSQPAVKIKSPEDAYKCLYKDLCFDSEEKLMLISIDSRNRLIQKDLITQGTVSETIISSREIYKKALSRNASSIIIAHNHPSQDITPSKEDIEATQNIFKTGKIIGVPLLDHLIVGKNGFSSLKRLGLINLKKEGGEINEN